MKKLTDIELEIKAETDRAVMVENLKGKVVWLPKSQIEIDNGVITLPEWLAIEKELI
jgi:hypothetical protein